MHTFKTEARRLQAFFTAAGQTLPLNQAQHAVAAIHGARNWQTLNATPQSASKKLPDEVALIQARNFWGEHPQFPRSAWQQEVGEGNVQSGYFDWLGTQLEQRDHQPGSGIQLNAQNQPESGLQSQHVTDMVDALVAAGLFPQAKRQCAEKAIVSCWSELIALVWGVGDVLSVAERLTEAQAGDVLRFVLRKHDATQGVNWDTLQWAADQLYPARPPDGCACPKCHANLAAKDSVRRCYVSKSELHGDAYGYGHFASDGTFQPDREAQLVGGNYDLLDDSDNCASCGTKI